jgi:hypothetical protein
MIRLTETMRKSRAFKHEPQARRALKERADALRRLELERAAR